MRCWARPAQSASVVADWADRVVLVRPDRRDYSGAHHDATR